MEINKPDDLAKAFPNHLLEIHTKVRGEPQKHYEVPDTIYIRHEIEERMLYIDTKFITAIKLKGLAKQWRDLPSYRGSMLKRISSGIGRTAPAVNCMVFDLINRSGTVDLDIEDTLKRIRKRRGKPLVSARKAKNKQQADKVQAHILTFAQQVNAWQETYGHLPLYEELKHYIKDAKSNYEQAYNMLSMGKRTRVRTAPSPVKTRKTAIHTAIAKRCKGLDEIITKDSDAIYKNIRAFITDEKGQLVLDEREYIPPMDKTEWLGRYEQGEESSGLKAYKDLYIPVSVFKSGAYESDDILNYKRDPRFVKVCQKYIGHRGFSCAHFDLLIKPKQVSL